MVSEVKEQIMNHTIIICEDWIHKIKVCSCIMDHDIGPNYDLGSREIVLLVHIYFFPLYYHHFYAASYQNSHGN